MLETDAFGQMKLGDHDYEPESVDVITDALRSKFGDEALRLAVGQLERADGGSVDVWREVVDRLRR